MPDELFSLSFAHSYVSAVAAPAPVPVSSLFCLISDVKVATPIAAGKSTLLNALIGANCLPANNVPETARITRITHALGCAELVDNTSGQNKIITGEEDIKSHLRYLNTETRTRDHLLSDEIYLDLKIPIAALKNRNDETAPHDVTIRLLDTPGPNEAGEIALKAQVQLGVSALSALPFAPLFPSSSA